MHNPTKADIIAQGYRMSTNANDATVNRCAQEMRHAYMEAYCDASDLTAAHAHDEVGQAWVALTFLRYMQDEEFATRTGGERKRMEWGEKLSRTQALKASVAERLRLLEEKFSKKREVRDLCGIYFKTQLFN